MKTILTILVVIGALAGCSSASVDDSTTGINEAAFTSVKLEKSRVEVFLNQTNTKSTIVDECLIESVQFRITYDNPTLPAGTKVSLHAGESHGDQDYIGDGMGYTPYEAHYWTRIRDVAMTPISGSWSVETSARPNGRMFQDWSSAFGEWRSEIYGATLQFVFRLELPDGTVFWDNRLRQDYWVNGNGPACPGGSTSGFVSVATWGPF